MADAPEPPRKYYNLKPREFERANPPAASPPNAPPSTSPAPSPPPAAAPGPNPAERIDVRDLYRQATGPGPVLSGTPKPREANDVTAILQRNVAHENAAGLNAVHERPRPHSRRRRDYLILMALIIAGFGAVTLHGLRAGDPLLFVFGLGGMVFAGIAVTWVIWFLMDRY